LILALVGAVAVLTGPALAGTPVKVTVTGEVEFNQIGAPPLGDVQSGESATMTFVVDSDIFEDNMVFPTRGYVIDQWSFSLAFDSAELGLQDPFPAGDTPYFVIRDNDPGVDGFFISTNLNHPFGFGLPLEQTGIFEQFKANYRVTYEGDTLPSLDIMDALGTYDFDGLTVFAWGVDDGPFELVMFIIFEQMTIEVVPVDDDGDGVLNDDDLCPDTMIPESVPTIHLGTNRWALVDDDGVFDTNPPNGEGPGFMFDLEDTGGCSCEQIIEMWDLGQGHEKFGCSNGVMLDWVLDVSGADYGDGDSGSSPPVLGTPIDPTSGLFDMQLKGDGRRTEDRVRPDRVRPGRADRFSSQGD
jgi:hypothetical protein